MHWIGKWLASHSWKAIIYHVLHIVRILCSSVCWFLRRTIYSLMTMELISSFSAWILALNSKTMCLQWSHIYNGSISAERRVVRLESQLLRRWVVRLHQVLETDSLTQKWCLTRLTWCSSVPFSLTWQVWECEWQCRVQWRKRWWSTSTLRLQRQAGRQLLRTQATSSFVSTAVLYPSYIAHLTPPSVWNPV